jgi:hypothetical protein
VTAVASLPTQQRHSAESRGASQDARELRDQRSHVVRGPEEPVRPRAGGEAAEGGRRADLRPGR